MSARILLVEDDPGVALTVADLLTAEGYQVQTEADGLSGFERGLREKFDLLILDLMLPGKNGLDVCRELRREGKDLAILMLTAKAQLTDRVVGLRIGADDYLAKPFEIPELLARVEALLRRRAPAARFRFGEIEVDFEAGEVRKSGELVALASREFELLRYLIDHRGNAVSRDELLEAVWEYQPGISSRTVDVHVLWIRQKLEENPDTPRHIKTVRGVGYRFSP